MKKFLFSFLVIVFTIINANAQEHLTFMEIPISGNYSTFVEQMKLKGFSFAKKETGCIFMDGKFANENANIAIFYTEKTKNVYRVFVMFDYEYNSWSSVKNDYLKFKEIYKKKYGYAQNEVERFKDPYYEGDGYEMQAIRINKCIYGSIFQETYGQIILSISYINGGTHIIISYGDKKGEALNEAEEDSSILNDI